MTAEADGQLSSVTLVTDAYVLYVQDTKWTLQRDTSQRESQDHSNSELEGNIFSTVISAHTIENEPEYIGVQLDSKAIGKFSTEDRVQASALREIVETWNTKGLPTSFTTAKLSLLLAERQQLRSHRQLNVQCLTWNANARLATFPCDVWARCLRPENEIIALGFQETDALGQNLVANAATLASAKSAIGSALAQTHTLVASNQLLGLMSLVYCHKDIAETAGPITYASSGTGFLGMWGNKGAVLIRFSLLCDPILGGGALFSFVNCHLSAGEDQGLNKRRRWELSEISTKFDIPGLALTDVERFSAAASEFDAADLSLDDDDEDLDGDDSAQFDIDGDTSINSVRNPFQAITMEDLDQEGRAPGEPDIANLSMSEQKSYLPHGLTPSPVTFLMGDLNYRIALDDSTTRSYIDKSLYDLLLRHDGLSREHKKHRVLGGFEEPQIRFPPTFKYGVGSSQYTGRVPSYTDRVFYRTNLYSEAIHYESLREHISDHLPVSLQVEITANTWNSEMRAALTKEALKMVDAAENRARVVLEIDPIHLEGSGPIFGTVSAWLLIKSPVNRPVHWSIHHGSQVTVTPNSGCLTPESKSISVLVKSSLTLTDREVEDVLIIRPERGFDQFVTVKFSSEPTILGLSLDELCERGKDDHGNVPNLPPQIWACTHYLWTHILPTMFAHKGEPSICQEILRWLYGNTPFDLELLDKANSTGTNAGIYSVCQVLVTIMTNLKEPLITREHIAVFKDTTDILDTLDSRRANLVIYLVGFYQHILSSGVLQEDARPWFVKMMFGHNNELTADENAVFNSLLS